VFAGILQGAEHTAIRQQDRIIEGARPRHHQVASGFLGDSRLRKNTLGSSRRRSAEYFVAGCF
jgi:hypothetical protein